MKHGNSIDTLSMSVHEDIGRWLRFTIIMSSALCMLLIAATIHVGYSWYTMRHQYQQHRHIIQELATEDALHSKYKSHLQTMLQRRQKLEYYSQQHKNPADLINELFSAVNSITIQHCSLAKKNLKMIGSSTTMQTIFTLADQLKSKPSIGSVRLQNMGKQSHSNEYQFTIIGKYQHQ